MATLVNDDKGGTPACGNSSNNNEYFHITSTVTSNIVGGRMPPVTIDSLVSPSVSYAQARGTLGVKIVDRNGAGLPGIAVSGSGPTALTTQNTDQNGCVVWRSIAIGSYTVIVNTSGYCDESGNTNLSRQQTASANTVSFVNFTYDRCASALVNVRTHIPGATFSTSATQVSKARDITDVSSNGTLKTWAPTSPATNASTYTLTNLFPYPASRYGFFTGECQYQSPPKLNAAYNNYFTNTNPGASILADATKPNQPVYVYQPPLNVRFARGYNNIAVVAGTLDVYLTLLKPTAFNSDSCADDVFKYTVADYPLTGWGTRPGAFTGYVSQDPLVFDPGLPFGTYSICVVDKTIPASPRTLQYTTASASTQYDNTTPNGASALLTINTGTGWTSGATCATS